MRKRVVTVLLPLLGPVVPPSTAQVSPCAPQGLVLETQGGTLGNSFAIDLSGGLPGAAGLVLFDTGGGPIPLSFGTFCVDFSPSLLTLPFNLDGAGALSLGGVLALNPQLGGQSSFIQGVAVDFTQPSFLALSNGGVIRLLPPQLYLVDPGLVTPVGSTPGNLASFDALTNLPGFLAPLPGHAAAAVRVAPFGWIAVLQLDGSVLLIDELTGAVAQTAAFPPSLGAAHDLAYDGGDRLLALFGGQPPSPFGGGVPGSLRALSLSTLALGVVTPFATTNPDRILLLDDPDLAYLGAGEEIVIANHAAGVELGSVSLGTGAGDLVDWLVDGGRLITLHPGIAANPFGGTYSPPGVNGVDLATGQPLFANPQTLATTGLASLLRAGPGPSGPALLVLLPDVGEIHLLNPADLVSFTAVAVPAGTGLLELSAGGSEWILVDSGSPTSPFAPPEPGNLLQMVPATLAVTSVSSLPDTAQTALVVLPSETLNRAYVLNGGNELLQLATDPLASPGLPIPLPGSFSPPVLTN